MLLSSHSLTLRPPCPNAVASSKSCVAFFRQVSALASDRCWKFGVTTLLTLHSLDIALAAGCVEKMSRARSWLSLFLMPQLRSVKSFSFPTFSTAWKFEHGFMAQLMMSGGSPISSSDFRAMSRYVESQQFTKSARTTQVSMPFTLLSCKKKFKASTTSRCPREGAAPNWHRTL